MKDFSYRREIKDHSEQPTVNSEKNLKTVIPTVAEGSPCLI